MSRTFTTLTACLAVLALLLALSPAAFAQAGDDQYADPFGEVPAEKPSPPPASDPQPPSSPPSGGGSSPSGTASSSLPTTTADTQAAEPGATAGSTTGGGKELARTGLPAGLLASVGLAMLLSGLFLRTAVARQDGRT